MRNTKPGFTLWTSELSPFSLKIEACLQFKQLSYQCLPKRNLPLKSLLGAIQIEWAKRRGRVCKYPHLTALDEYPAVPFLIEAGGRIQYDSTAISRWLDDNYPQTSEYRLWPEDPTLRFIARLLDDAMDEFGLYLAHHMRWVISPHTNTAGKRLYKEFGSLLFWAGETKFAREFSRRQTRRLPYLFSMPPQGFSQNLPDYLTAPQEVDWPETHSLLNHVWTELLACLEAIISLQPYMLGERFTMADAGIYGMLGMLLDDPSADDDMLRRAPLTRQWLVDIRAGKHCHQLSDKPLFVSDRLAALLNLLGEVFLPLMQQNAEAYKAAKASGETLFNEAAWREGRALYTGELLGYPYKAVVKTFQVQVWQDLQDCWSALSSVQRSRLEEQVRILSLLPSPISDPAIGEPSLQREVDRTVMV